MTPARSQRYQVQAQRHAAVQALARERVVRDALDELDPQPDDAHLDSGGLLDRLADVVGVARRRVAEE